MSKTEAAIQSLLSEAVTSAGAELVGVELQKNGKDLQLLVYIDKPGGVFLDDCERVSRIIDPLLDEADPIESAYTLVVSSPGLDRPLKKRSDFDRAIGKTVEVKLYKPFMGKKLFTGELLSCGDESFSIAGDDAEISFTYAEAALVRLHIDF